MVWHGLWGGGTARTVETVGPAPAEKSLGRQSDDGLPGGSHTARRYRPLPYAIAIGIRRRHFYVRAIARATGLQQL